MTNITADYFRNTKIKILSPEHSKQVQEAVFAVSGKWPFGKNFVKNECQNYLFFNDELCISYSSLGATFDNCKYKEITFPPKEEENIMTIDYEQYVGKTLKVVKNGWGFPEEYVGAEFKVTGYDTNGYFGEEGFIVEGYSNDPYGAYVAYVGVKSFDLTQPEKWKPVAGEEVFVNLQERKYRTRFVGVDSVGRGVFELHSGMASIYGKELGFDSLDMSQFSPIPKTKLIHGVEVPDISFVPEMDNWYYHPVPDLPRLFAEDMHTIHSDNYTYRVNAGLCYPYTEEGKQAAILHAKAMLGIVEQTDKGE